MINIEFLLSLSEAAANQGEFDRANALLDQAEDLIVAALCEKEDNEKAAE